MPKKTLLKHFVKLSCVLKTICIISFSQLGCLPKKPIESASGSQVWSALGDGSYTPVVIVLGGFWSCGQDPKNAANWSPLFYETAAGPIVGIAARNIEAVREASGQKVDKLLSCYSPDPRKINFVSTFTSSKDTSRSDVGSMFIEINRQLEQLKNPRVALVGHSYGGWTAMKLALALTPKATLTSLVTLDPISRILCSPDYMINNLMPNKKPDECLKAPQDFTAADLAKITEKTRGEWYNYYQTETSILHSGPIEAPGIKNIQKSYKEYEGKLGGHIQFLVDEPLVQEITQILAKNIKK